ncbi:MAG: hypothetical protein ACKVY0_25005 [Prosthecobacter sp.]|uniref:hypothetical protein n=1 Tax=Prosthecobacter sp. TaxID=1965333 RepID=UPI0039019EFD
MHPPVAVVDQPNVRRKRRTRGKARLTGMMRGVVVIAASAIVTAFVLWLKEESPHPQAVEARRESPLAEARSLKPLLETAQSSQLASYAMKKGIAEPPPEKVQPRQDNATTTNRVLPVWLVADAAESAELLKQSLRERGARQMGPAVRFAMLNVAELMALDAKTWSAGLATAAASENKASALLLTFYLYYLDRAGDGAGVTAFLRAVENQVPQEQAVRDFILAGRSMAEFESEMGRLFHSVGIELQFMRRGGLAFKP